MKYHDKIEKALAYKLIRLKGRCKNGRGKAIDKGPPTSFNLTNEWLFEQYGIQHGRCFFTDIDMELKSSGSGGPMWNSLSFDRLDSKKGYLQGNTVLALHGVNLIRGRFNSMNGTMKKKIFNKHFLIQTEKFENQVKKGKKIILP